MKTYRSTYTLAAESPRWWWTSASAAGVATIAIAAILCAPATGHAIPIDTIGGAAPPAAEVGVYVAPDPGPERPCFMVRTRWNAALDGFQPTCGGRFGSTRGTIPAVQEGDAPARTSTWAGVWRAGLDHLP